MRNILFVLALASGLTTYAQSKDSAKTAAVRSLVESQNYVFQAQTALPLHGATKLLSSSYSMLITPDKIACALPYFGRAYQAPIDPSTGGMDFTSKQFAYTIKPGKKGGWEIVIKPKDLKDDDRQLYLSISQDGYASLRVISRNEDAISYNGVIANP